MPQSAVTLLDRIARFAPGVPELVRYRLADLPCDLAAGVSVAAVALPVGVAYAQIAGLGPETGLYASLLPLIAYALFGTSRQLIVGPDAATCALIAASVAPLAAGDAARYAALSGALACLAGLFCIAASFLRLGALADFLSRPILVGLMNGVSVSILLGQIGKLFGFPIEAGGIVPRLLEFVSRLGQTHWPTLGVGLAALAAMALAPRLLRPVPPALVATVVGAALVAGLGLDARGVAVLGVLPAGLPALQPPGLPLDELPTLLASAAGLALVSFSSGMLTARSFAARNRYEIDVDREFAALGAANIAAALTQGFAISGADSRTAMNDAAGGRTRAAGLFAAVVIAVVLQFLTAPLAYVPVAALGAVLVYAALSLFDYRALRDIYRMDRVEGGLAVLTMLGVVGFGAINAILLAVSLALVRFVRITARPRDEVLGKVEGIPGLHSVERHRDARTFPGLVIYRFDGPLTFFNANYFRQRALLAADAAGAGLRWFVIDAIPLSSIDVTGLYAMRDVYGELAGRGVRFVIAGRRAELLAWLDEHGFYKPEHDAMLYPTLRQALKTFRREVRPVRAPLADD